MLFGIIGRTIDPQGRTCSLSSGKDTVADVFLASGCADMPLADPIKSVAMQLYPAFTREHLWGPSQMRSVPVEVYPGVYLTARHVLQKLGTEVARYIWEDTWSFQVARRYEYIKAAMHEHPVHAVVSDVRFRSEIEFLRKSVGDDLHLILVERPVEALPEGSDLSHQSEQDLAALRHDDVHTVILNSGSLNELIGVTAFLVARLLKTPTEVTYYDSLKDGHASVSVESCLVVEDEHVSINLKPG